MRVTVTVSGALLKKYGMHSTLGALVSPVMVHSSNSGGQSNAVALAFSTNGSLMILIVKPLPFLTLFAVSLSRVGPPAFTQQNDTTGGKAVTWTPSLRGVSGRTTLLHGNTPC